MKKVITFGTFDIVHPGHEYYLKQAKVYGDFLITIIARDETVKKIKGFYPKYNEQERLRQIYNLGLSDVVQLGSLGDPLKVIKDYTPDIVALGYDQTSFIHELSNFLYETKMRTEVITIDSLRPKKYKSSLLKK